MRYITKIAILLFLFLVAAPTLFSQEEAVIDSLLKALKKAPEKQSAEILNSLAKEFKWSDHDKCYEYANKALELAEKYNDEDQIAMAYFNLAESDLEFRKYDDAKNNYTKALANVRETKNKILLVDILTSYGGLLDDLGNEKGRALLEEAINVAKEITYHRGIVKSVNYLGFSYYFKNEFSKAIEYFEESYALCEELKDTSSMELNARVLGACYFRKGNYTEAVKKYIEALKINDKLNQVSQAAATMLNIANIYQQQKSYDEALEYFMQAKNNFEIQKDSINLAVCYNNIAILLRESVDHTIDTLKKANKYTIQDSIKFVDDYIKSKTYIDSAIYINEILKDTAKLASNYGNRADILVKLLRYKEAASEYQKALDISEKLKDKRQICNILINAGELYFKTKNYAKAYNYFKRSLKIANELGLVERQRGSYEGLSWVYEKFGNYKKALSYYKLFIEKKDILFNEESQKVVRQMKELYESEKKEQQIKLLNTESELQRADLKRQKTVNVAIGIGAIFLLGFLVFVFLQLRLIQKKNVLLNEKNIQINQQKDEIEAQRDEIEAQRDTVMKQKEEITDSIYYARRIQKAILPSDSFAEDILPEHFILFRPRDIVSGDFYWMTRKNNQVITVAADCTGHGVPGAFMSMLGVSFLNEIVNKLENPEAHIILNQLREYVKTTLDQTGKKDEAKDGMDVSLTIYDFKKLTVEYAGAYNPLYITRKGEEEIIEYKADKMPIGIYIKEKESFTKHIIQLQPGDTVYTFSDGFVDQFGGEAGRKFMSKPFKRLLMGIQHEPMAEQREILNTTIDGWRGDLDQIDDIIILGIRIPG